MTRFLRTWMVAIVGGVVLCIFAIGAFHEASRLDAFHAARGGERLSSPRPVYEALQCRELGLCGWTDRFLATFRKGRIHVLDPDLDWAMEELRHRSPTVRRWLAELEAEGATVFVGRRDQIPFAFQPEYVAVSGVVFHALRLPRQGAVIAVDMDAVRLIAERPDRTAYLLEVAETLGHELAHIAVREDGVGGAFVCRDPERGQDYLDSCVGKWDNRVRAEIGTHLLYTYYPPEDSDLARPAVGE